MPMLHRCAFRDCATATLNTYCFEHALRVRAQVEAERTHLTARDAPLAREVAAALQPARGTVAA